MLAPVVVHGLPLVEEVRAAVLSSCTAALGQRRCVADSDLNYGAPRDLTIAFVAWSDSSSRRVRVVLERRGTGETTTLRRDVHFADDDPPLERSRAIGLVIAALVGESEVGGATADVETPSSGRLASASRPNWFGAAAFVGPGLDRGLPRLGATATAGVGLSMPFFVAASASYAVRLGDADGLSVRWVTGGVGAGVRTVWPGADLVLRGRVEMNVQYIFARLAAASVVAAGGADRVVPGVSMGFEGAWPASTAWSLVGGANVSSFAGGTAIRLDQRNLGSSQWLAFSGFLGAAWSFR